MRTNTNLNDVLNGIENMANKQIEKEMANEEKVIDKYHAPVNYGTYTEKIKALQEAVQGQATELAEKVSTDLPKYLYVNHAQFEMPRFISMQPSKQTGLYHETIMDRAMDGATSLNILSSAVPVINAGKKVSCDFLDYASVLSNAKKDPAKQNTVFHAEKTDLPMPVIVKEFVAKEPETGVENVKYYKTAPCNFVENTPDGSSKIQPRLYQRLNGITQDEANNMYWVAERKITENLEAQHPEAFATLTENQRKYKTLPRYITNDTPLPVQEAMYTKEIANAFIAIQTHMPETEAKVSHATFLNKSFNPMYPENLTDYNQAVKANVYEAAMNAHNVAEAATAIVLGKRIKMTVAAEKEHKQEQGASIPKKQAKDVAKKINRRSKAQVKAKEKDQGLEM